jgi:hypothetical protein
MGVFAHFKLPFNLNYNSSLYILDTRLLPDTNFTNIFSHLGSFQLS